MERNFDVIVVGGGHAGCEAAATVARRGAKVALVTMNPAAIGAMSCNPAIGGVGKGHLVREIDVFDGLLANAADRASIHYRMLNRSRGCAVWGPRVQADRNLFAAAVQDAVRRQCGLTVIAGEAARLQVDRDQVLGLVLADGGHLNARAVVIASGTFLRGRLFTGMSRTEGGRCGESASIRLADQLRELAPHRRLKTGTPPRLDGRTIDWSRLARQPSDAEHWTMAPWTQTARNPQIACAITRTNLRTHDLIRAASDRSPLLSGDITAPGPRYCPSIEDKVRRFGDRDGHQIFLEPEGLDTPLVYPNGISTSLDEGDQLAFVRSIEGLERAVIRQPGYAVEYDSLDPRRLDTRLASRSLNGLFLAGQVNGTTGYEEAAAQGLVAGLNAAAHACDLEPVLFGRRDSYIGVMIDDLTLQGVTEPYRMLTARAEHRLHLRSDNAEARLFRVADAAGCLSEQSLSAGRRRMALREIGSLERLDAQLRAELEETAKYRPYVDRALRSEELLESADASLPSDLGYSDIPGLSQEMRERLAATRPATLNSARRLAGITPAAATALLAASRRHAA